MRRLLITTLLLTAWGEEGTFDIVDPDTVAPDGPTDDPLPDNNDTDGPGDTEETEARR